MTVVPFLIFRSVNSKLFGTGVMCRVPAVSLFMKSREFAPVTVDGLNSVSKAIPVPPPTLELLRLSGSAAVIWVKAF